MKEEKIANDRLFQSPDIEETRSVSGGSAPQPPDIFLRARLIIR